jgi:SAM-dependent methyltransferase
MDDFAPNHSEALEAIAAARNYNHWIFARARPYLGRRILDAGAGIGTFTGLAAATGADVTALEPHPEFADRLRRQFAATPAVRVVEADAGRLDEFDGVKFDAIMCFNVLEHIDDDRATLCAFSARLVPGGRLLLLVPAHPRLYGATDEAIGHRRRYTRTAVGSRLVEAGLDVDVLRYVNPLGALGWFLSVRLRKRRDWPVGQFKVFDQLVPVLRAADRFDFGFGLSVWAVATRRA